MAQATVVMRQKSGPGVLVRALWFLFIGWWLTGIVSVIAWVAMATLLGLPLGAYLINRIPTVLTLRPRTQNLVATQVGGTTFVTVQGRSQQSALVRVVWFIFIGWWASALWMTVAYLLVLASVITLGISLVPALLMYNRTPFIATLYRY
jgi:uncharacterized membrane protein YccF (DUF307 family)